MKRVVAGLLILSVALTWAAFPIFIESADSVLALILSPSAHSECPAGSACFTLELRNRGPWPVLIDIVELQFYPSLIGPSLSVNWVGAGPDKSLVLIPFTGRTYSLWIGILSGLRPPETLYAVLTANVTVVYVFHQTTLHSGKR